jgi:hypothetical protein
MWLHHPGTLYPLTPPVPLITTTAGAKWLGCAFGMGIGCLLGLIPLAFMESPAAALEAAQAGAAEAGAAQAGSGSGDGASLQSLQRAAG